MQLHGEDEASFVVEGEFLGDPGFARFTRSRLRRPRSRNGGPRWSEGFGIGIALLQESTLPHCGGMGMGSRLSTKEKPDNGNWENTVFYHFAGCEYVGYLRRPVRQDLRSSLHRRRFRARLAGRAQSEIKTRAEKPFPVPL